jgi:hypothetical protein
MPENVFWAIVYWAIEIVYWAIVYWAIVYWAIEIVYWAIEIVYWAIRSAILGKRVYPRCSLVSSYFSIYIRSIH